MFGYVQPLKCELKMKEYDTFKAYYCGLCKAMGKRYGKRTQFLVNYDCTFLGLLVSSLKGGSVEIKTEVCAYNPLLKKAVARGAGVDYAADVNMLLSYHKLRDDWRDRRSVKAALGLLLLAVRGRRAAKREPEAAEEVHRHVTELTKLEREKCASADIAADETGNMLKAVFVRAGRSDADRQALGELGYNIGRWVYLIDALDDIEDDAKHGRYNPFLLSGFANGYKNATPEDWENIRFSLNYTLHRAAAAFELLDVSRNRGLLENIIYAGMLAKTDEIISVRSRKNESV